MPLTCNSTVVGKKSKKVDIIYVKLVEIVTYLGFFVLLFLLCHL